MRCCRDGSLAQCVEWRMTEKGYNIYNIFCMSLKFFCRVHGPPRGARGSAPDLIIIVP
jgi:hypothetical protein